MKNRLKFILPFVLIFVVIFCSSCTIKLEDCIVFDKSEFVELKKEDNRKIDENALRIMSSNVLVHIKSWGGEQVKPRAQRYAEVVKHYAPDVICMQEMCSDWYKYLLPQIEKNYQLIEPKHSVFQKNKTPIIYNKTKLNLIESRVVRFSKGDNNGCRNVTLGVFERKSDGKKFAVLSTHFDLIRMNNYDKEKSIMLLQCEEFVSVVKSIKEKFGNIPVFMGGDYNSMENENSRYTGEQYSIENDLTFYKTYGKPCGSFLYNKICENGFIDVKFVDGVERHFKNSKGYLYDDPTYDHIFMSSENDAKVLSFRVLASDYYLPNDDGSHRISDHLPIVADLLI